MHNIKLLPQWAALFEKELMKKETPSHVFPCEFCKIFKGSFFIEHLRRLFLYGLYSISRVCKCFTVVVETRNESTYESIQILNAYSEPYRISKMEIFVKIVNDWMSLTIFAKAHSNLWQSSEYASGSDQWATIHFHRKYFLKLYYILDTGRKLNVLCTFVLLHVQGELTNSCNLRTIKYYKTIYCPLSHTTHMFQVNKKETRTSNYQEWHQSLKNIMRNISREILNLEKQL